MSEQIQEQWDEELEGVKDFWGGTIADVKEEKNLVPPARDIPMTITETKLYSTYDDGSVRNWKQILVKFRLDQGIEVDNVTKYKGMLLTQMMPYFAQPTNYDYTKPFFAKGQFLVPLQQIIKSTNIEAPSLIKGGLTDEVMETVAESLKNKTILGSVLQTKVTSKNVETGKYEPTGDLQNEVKNFKIIPEDMLV